ncbi:hypothetical protein M0812_13486 [Anaeramoeba flamelloides]|uniref:Uncharacterized protein n=1 Tax=Anaeramoeba flamelloides TaxID=1746091 RepID=A0AAV7ZNR5_9EUKA|nr:hypothetical protein M0812_13486 [Anaeramoeba flamelloides]
MEITDQEILNFGDLFWGFGYYLFRSIDDNEIFREKKMQKYFLRALFPKSKLKRRSHKKHLELVTVLMNQNSVFLRSESKTVVKSVLNIGTNTTQIKRQRSHHTPHPNQYFLNPHWRALFMDPKYSFSPFFEKQINEKTVRRLPPKKRSTKFSPQKVSHPDRTIGILGFKIHKILQNGPKTREQIENETKFPRQRVSLVLTVYKSLKMVLEDQSTGYFYWNYEQSVTFPKTTSYFSELIKAKKTKQLLTKHLSCLSQRLMKKIEQKKNIPQETQQKLNTALNQLSTKLTKNTTTNNNNNNNETVPSKSEIRELLASLTQKRRHLRQLRNYTQSVLNHKTSKNGQFCMDNKTTEEIKVETITAKQPITRITKKTKTKTLQNQQELPFKRRRSRRRFQQQKQDNPLFSKTENATNTPQFEQPKATILDNIQVQPPKMESFPSSPLSLSHESNVQDLIETDSSSDDDDDDGDDDDLQPKKNCMQITDTRENHNKTNFTHEEILLRGRSKKETEAVQAILKLKPFFLNQQVNKASFASQQQDNSPNKNFSLWLSLLQNNSSTILK